MLKWIEGYEGLYEVSTNGDIISYKRYKEGKLMSPKVDKDGYLEVGLRDNEGNRKFYRVHRLVAQAFIPNPNGLPEINHKDCNESNNEVSNLEWCDKSHNNKHKFIMGYNTKGERATTAKLKNEQVLEIYHSKGITEKKLAEKYGVTRSCISNIRLGYTWSHITKEGK